MNSIFQTKNIYHIDSLVGKPVSESVHCPDCNSINMRTDWIKDSFQYGGGNEAVELNALIPVEVCEECGFSMLGEKAMEIRHDVVCQHLNLLTPSEIKEIRTRVSKSQAAFSDLSGLGVASLNRWESGSQLQNKSSDRLLRLLAKQNNAEYLYNELSRLITTKGDKGIDRFRPRILSPEDVEIKKQLGNVFKLRKVA